ncbi:MAG: GH3 auxin-responsive promoter family protein [Desulfatitalea sp.]|nr:GH3 auxin-responsive promoter family protein [Desulfatitalea sp.]
MHKISCWIINSVCQAKTFFDCNDFIKRIPSAAQIQKDKLLHYLDNNKQTVFGKLHNFSSIKSYKEYKDKVPIYNYEDYKPWIERIAGGEKNVLVSEEIGLFEPTGGTTSGTKLIPYTKSLQKEFQNAINPWLYDLYHHFNTLKSGQSYWSITPVTDGNKTTKCGTPIGFEEDSHYLGLLGRIISKVFVTPPEIKFVRNIDNFRHITSLFLLKSGNLSMISVWNPTFLILQTDYIKNNFENLVKDIHDGTVALPNAENIEFITGYFKPAPQRAHEIERHFQGESKTVFKKIWKNLCLISCWADASSKNDAQKLSSIFPSVHIQPKGLLATEGIITIPMITAQGCVPAYQSHFLEFLPKGEKDTRLLHELETGGDYTVLLTNGGGLFRYNLQDNVSVTGRAMGLPILKFTGRHGVSDIVGEKIAHSHAQSIVDAMIYKRKFEFKFILLAPEQDENGYFYTLFIESTQFPIKDHADTMLKDLKHGLDGNFYYKNARELGQLKPEKIFHIYKNGKKMYMRRCLENQRLGDIKNTVLDLRTGWSHYFTGEFL